MLKLTAKTFIVFSGLLILGACTSTDLDTQTAAQTELLFADGEVSILEITEGPGSTVQGSQGMGRFLHPYRAASNTYGPAPVIEHTATSLTFQGPNTTCTVEAAGRLSCLDGSRGTWRRSM